MRRSVNVVGWQSMGESADADADGRRVNIYSGGASGCRGVTLRDGAPSRSINNCSCGQTGEKDADLAADGATGPWRYLVQSLRTVGSGPLW